MTYRIYKKTFEYNPTANYFLLQCRKHWWDEWNTIKWFDWYEEELANKELYNHITFK